MAGNGILEPEMALAVDNSTLSVVRREVRKLEAQGLSPECLQTAVLLANELVANAIRHGGAEEVVHLAVAYTGDVVRIGVRQPGAFERPSLETDGLGLLLLDRLADKWDTALLPDGSTLVSFELIEEVETR
jgi:anti-sigma regulatory factor (Ser/Thr protein kinase)